MTAADWWGMPSSHAWLCLLVGLLGVVWLGLPRKGS